MDALLASVFPRKPTSQANVFFSKTGQAANGFQRLQDAPRVWQETEKILETQEGRAVHSISCMYLAEAVGPHVDKPVVGRDISVYCRSGEKYGVVLSNGAQVESGRGIDYRLSGVYRHKHKHSVPSAEPRTVVRVGYGAP